MAPGQHAGMPSLGDLANDVARWVYDARIPVVIGLVIAVVVVVAIARRFGWFAAARRHPRASAMLAAGVLAVTVPIGWYLGSPLFVRTSLVEARPTVAVASSPPLPSRSPAPSAVASASPTAPPPSSSVVPPTPSSPTPLAPITLATGEFSGTDDFHFGRGTASIVQVGPTRYHLRLEDFSVRNGPDLYVYLSRSANGSAIDGLELGRLKATDGSFGYDLPAGVDPGDFASAIIWCKQFSHLFAVAPFGGPGNS